MRDPASFRDPSGYVFSSGDRIFRAINDQAHCNFARFRSSGAYEDLRSKGWIIAADEVDAAASDRAGPHTLEHPKLRFISYPYEWPFTLLKRAALRHLEIHLRALDFEFTLSDASAYNVQFIGTAPIFIDTPSFIPYREGDYWAGQRQFIEQFVNPLLLRSLFGIAHNAWYRGALEGVPTRDIAHLIGPLKRWLAPNLLTNIALPDLLQRKAQQATAPVQGKPRPLPKKALLFMLRRLQRWISRLQPRDVGPTEWQDYGDSNVSYAGDEESRKRAFVAEFSRAAAPSCAWDLGCNTGEYCEVLLRNNAKSAIGFDLDHNALEAAVGRASTGRLQFLPLYSDAANPSPRQGWAEVERLGLHSRAGADAVIALAIVHHLAIGKNVPLASVVGWLTGLAPRGVIEFVPKSDPMIARMLQLRKDIFADYDKDHFEQALGRHCRIARTLELSPGGRTLYEFERRAT
ncbi:class I SAM-dependent methyltransferase [Bradyrhizobium lablabi]|uniref:class I SAM-dependent methyltransferase n=1 Tax=Bradyrhizobium lablabi TaxID=722472 RepID=UPI002011A404|nr:class I SAM-dependent methyltransferase [Bradyrhizobium lablabi]